jgi:hypothetical protein
MQRDSAEVWMGGGERGGKALPEETEVMGAERKK